MIVRVDVTEDDFKNGRPCGIGGDCAGELAMKRTALAPLHPVVGAGWVGLTSSEESGLMLRLPEWVDDHFGAFDDGIPVEPFSFELDVPDELLAGLL